MAYKDYEEMLSWSKRCKWYENTKKNWEYIDSLDLLPIINKYNNLDDVIDEIEDIYHQDAPSDCCGEDPRFRCVLNYINTEEFAMFIRNKYNISFVEKETIVWEKVQLWNQD